LNFTKAEEEEFQRLKKYYANTSAGAPPDVEIRRHVFLDNKFKVEDRKTDLEILSGKRPKGKAGRYKELNRFKKLIHNYNEVIKNGERNLEISRDSLINAVITEYLKLGVPNELLPNKEYMKNV